MVSITNKYSDPVHFNNLLTEVGLNHTQRARLEIEIYHDVSISISLSDWWCIRS